MENNIVEHNYIEEETGGVPIKMWTRGVPVEDAAKRQLQNAARMAIIFKHAWRPCPMSTSASARPWAR